jgi:tRNA(Ile)-lysidine synthase
MAVQRRLLRHASAELGAAPDFPATESLRALALTGKAGQKIELAQGLHAERTPREIRLSLAPGLTLGTAETPPPSEYELPIPGEVVAVSFGLRVQIVSSPISASSDDPSTPSNHATLRNWKPGDRVTLRHSNGPRKVKEVLERLRITGTSRALWPVLELGGRIVWMKGVDVEPIAGIKVVTSTLAGTENDPV